MKFYDKEFEKYISEKQITDRIATLAKQISADYQDEPPVIIGVLNGAFMFTTHLVEQIAGDIQVTFTKFSSYVETKSSGKVVELIGFDDVVTGRKIILVEDIVDTGLTLVKLIEAVQPYKPKDIKVASLLLKPDALQNEVKVDYLGFEIPNKFVIGYGMDYKGLGRNLVDIYQLKNG